MATKKIAYLITLLFIFSENVSAQEWKFDAILNDKIIGQHTFRIDNKKTISSAKFHIEFMFMDIYYKHVSTELWTQGCLTKIDSKTDDDGKIIEVNGLLNGNEFLIKTNKLTESLPACIMTFAYWDPNMLKEKKLLNPQNAEWLDIETTLIKQELLSVKGQNIMTNHYVLKGTKEGNERLVIDLWYDKEMNWVGLKSPTPIGDIFYKLI
ncbi:MAG: DUF6134 family protein [Methylophilaceae bacterium]|nr:DUF6134 family protein [Methylophilaceae bacterium]